MTTKTKILIALGALFIGCVVWAAAEQRVDRAGGKFPVHYNQGLYIGPDSARVTNSTTNKINRTVECLLDYDFPSYTKGYTKCSTDKAFTCSGVKLGDPCFVGVAQATPSDGGSAYIPGVIMTAIARADDTIQLCANFLPEDGGAHDLPDAGYRARCLSSQ